MKKKTRKMKNNEQIPSLGQEQYSQSMIDDHPHAHSHAEGMESWKLEEKGGRQVTCGELNDWMSLNLGTKGIRFGLAY